MIIIFLGLSPQLLTLNVIANESSTPNTVPASVAAVKPPSPPLNLYVHSLSEYISAIYWEPPLDSGGANITGYKIERSDDGGPFKEVINKTIANLAFTDNIDNPTAKTHSYRISATNGVYFSAPSAVASISVNRDIITTQISVMRPDPIFLIGNGTIVFGISVGYISHGNTPPTGTVVFSDNGGGGNFSAESCVLSSGHCTVTYSPPFRTGMISITWLYNGDVTHDLAREKTCVMIETAAGYFLNPNEQIRLGINPIDIVCLDGFVLLERTSGGTVCATLANNEHLIRTGWAHIVTQPHLASKIISLYKVEQMYKPQVFTFNGPELGLLHYNGTRNNLTQFAIYELSPGVFNLPGGQGRSIIFDCSLAHTCDFAALNVTNRFVWMFWHVNGPQGGVFDFVDAKTGEFIGTHTNCPVCICLSGHTIIDTPAGPAEVKNTKVGTQVWTTDTAGHRVQATVIKTNAVQVPAVHAMVQLELADGRQLITSARHPTSDGRMLGDLRVGDILDNSKVKSIGIVLYNEDYTYDILPSGQTGSYWANGILIGSTLR